MGGIKSGDPNVANDLAQTAANHEQSAIGDQCVTEGTTTKQAPLNTGPLGDVDGPDPGSEGGAEYDENGAAAGSDAGAQEDGAMGSDDHSWTPEESDDPPVDPDQGGGDLL